MRIAIAGAGAVGRSIARDLLARGHQVMLIERDQDQFEPSTVEQAEWVHADACELASLEDLGMQLCDVVIAATGDDKTNLVVALLAKTEFSVRRVVSRVNDPANEWLFTESWGVDVAVSTPRILAGEVEEAVSVGDLVELLSLRQGQANLVEITLPNDAALADHSVRELALPEDAALVAIVRRGKVIVPRDEETFEAGDELVFVASADVEPEVRAALGLG